MLSKYVNKHKGDTCMFIGKGPSLDLLTKQEINKNIIIYGINDAICKISELGIQNTCYAVQQDGKVLIKTMPEGCVCFCSEHAFKFCPEPKILYNRQALGITQTSRTIMAAIELAKLMGIANFLFYAFDACTTGTTEYAKCAITPFPRTSYIRGLAKQKQEILQRAGAIPCTFLTLEVNKKETIINTCTTA